MRRLTIIVLTLVGIGVDGARAAVSVEGLLCEGRRDPLGIDAPRPRLCWVLLSDRRAQVQGAYRVLVASTSAAQAEDRGDLWDSGRVASDRSIHVRYEGKPLASLERCHWKVRVWDGSGEPSAWSEPASFTLGLLGDGAWRARWIGAGGGTASGLDGSSWIWSPGGDGPRRSSGPTPSRCPPPPGGRSGRDGTRCRLVREGENVLAVSAVNGGAAPNPAGLIGRLEVELDGAPAVVVATDASWKVSGLGGEGWRDRDFDDSSWPTAREVGKLGCAPWRPCHRRPRRACDQGAEHAARSPRRSGEAVGDGEALAAEAPRPRSPGPYPSHGRVTQRPSSRPARDSEAPEISTLGPTRPSTSAGPGDP